MNTITFIRIRVSPNQLGWLPYEPSVQRRITAQIVDDQGIESLKVVEAVI